MPENTETLRDVVAEIIECSGYPSDDVAEHMHKDAALMAADRILRLSKISEALNNTKCACGAEATHHECSSCSAFHNTCV